MAQQLPDRGGGGTRCAEHRARRGHLRHGIRLGAFRRLRWHVSFLEAHGQPLQHALPPLLPAGLLRQRAALFLGHVGRSPQARPAIHRTACPGQDVRRGSAGRSPGSPSRQPSPALSGRHKRRADTKGGAHRPAPRRDCGDVRRECDRRAARGSRDSARSHAPLSPHAALSPHAPLSPPSALSPHAALCPPFALCPPSAATAF
mmetsp:Transcript_26710/g.84692  ORF Transcript_26710/g.84692 Transcript_26710/m.84692 type:complete len:203 (+) Transcript_26710:448-1056(+)